MFEIQNVSKKYKDDFALDSVSLTIGKGLNFVVGPSGSGKTTLLKIISGMEQDFQGEVLYCGRSIKDLTEAEKGYFYNNVFAFVWQDFNLIEEGTVIENVLLPQYLKEVQNKKLAEKILKELKIFNIADKKVKYLSGGQKQRVAIARELMKNPQVIIADEPTSALDEKTSKVTMDILRQLSKTRSVIVVTHDSSFIEKKDNVYELDKGELITKPEIIAEKHEEIKMDRYNTLNIKNAFTMAKVNMKNKFGLFTVATLSLLVAAVLLLTTVSGAISSSGQKVFEDLYDTYGRGILDISIVGNFMSAAGQDNSSEDEPKADVSQDIGGLYEKYKNDSRVEHILFINPFGNIKVNIEGAEYSIEQSNNVPVLNELVAGKMPMGDTNEVVIPQSLVEMSGLKEDEIIGKTLEFKGTVYNWSSGEPILKQVSTTAVIVGVADTNMFYKYEDQVIKTSIDDSFFFNKSALDEMRSQARIEGDKISFNIRVNTPEDLIDIKNELNGMGIVPLGQFELVEDFVGLNNQTKEQSGTASVIIAVLSIFMVIAIFLITGVMRKREYAIYKVSGFNKRHLCLLNFMEIIAAAFSAIIILIVASPMISFVTMKVFQVDIISREMLSSGTLILLGLGVVAYVTTAWTFTKLNIGKALKTGDR